MKMNEITAVVVSFAILALMIIGMSKLGKSYENDNHDHSLCAKATEIKSEETDSLELELARAQDDLRHCEDLNRELNNQKK